MYIIQRYNRLRFHSVFVSILYRGMKETIDIDYFVLENHFVQPYAFMFDVVI